MIGSDTHIVVHLPGARVCVKHPEKLRRTTERTFMKAHPKIILHENADNYNAQLLLDDSLDIQS